MQDAAIGIFRLPQDVIAVIEGHDEGFHQTANTNVIHKFVFSVCIIQQVAAGIIHTVGVAVNGIDGVRVTVGTDPNGISINNFTRSLCILKQHTAVRAGIVGNIAVGAASGFLCGNQSQGMNVRLCKQNLQLQNLGIGLAVLQMHDPIGLFLCRNGQLINCIILALPRIVIAFGSGITDLSGAQTADHQLAAFGKRQNAAFGNWQIRIVVIGIDHSDVRHLGLTVGILIQRRDPLGLNGDACIHCRIIGMNVHYRKSNVYSLYGEGEITVLIGIYDLIEKVCVDFVGREDDPSSGHGIAECIQKSAFYGDSLCRLHRNVGVGHVDQADILLDGQLLGGVVPAQRNACVVLHRAVNRHLHGAHQRLAVLTGYHQLAAVINVRIGCADFFVGKGQHARYGLAVNSQRNRAVKTGNIHILTELNQYALGVTIRCRNDRSLGGYQTQIHVQLRRRNGQPAIYCIDISRGIGSPISVLPCNDQPLTGRRHPGVVAARFGGDGADLTVVLCIPQNCVAVFILIIDADGSALHTVG